MKRVDKMKLTIALQNEMKAEIDRNGNVVIDIPDDCKRDLWDAQMEYWLEKCVPEHGSKIIDNGFFRIIRNKLRFIRNKN